MISIFEGMIFALFGEDMFLGEEMEIYFKIWDMEHVWTGTPPSSFVLVNLIMMNTYDRHCEITFSKIIFYRIIFEKSSFIECVELHLVSGALG